VILLIACAIPVTCANAQFVSPIEGTAYVDWSIINYVDLDPGPGTLDYLGGAHTYDGHKAIDFAIAGFAAMDAGVDIYAAADGVVSHLYDDHFDRCTFLALCGHYENNFITIDHGDGLVTQYLHLKTDSATVEIGQAVQSGMKIGEVGSSGWSSMPHLHFEVYENGNPIETFLDPERWWDDPPLYALDVPNILDHRIIDHTPTQVEQYDQPVSRHVLAVAWLAGTASVGAVK
jgi:murein DD-endopeptidase MepM/ murein hydrolase activator NlpD